MTTDETTYTEDQVRRLVSATTACARIEGLMMREYVCASGGIERSEKLLTANLSAANLLSALRNNLCGDPSDLISAIDDIPIDCWLSGYDLHKVLSEAEVVWCSLTSRTMQNYRKLQRAGAVNEKNDAIRPDAIDLIITNLRTASIREKVAAAS